MELKNKRVLVTGGSSGIGLALAHALIARGARVVITGRRRSVLDDALRSLDSATGVCADVGSPEGRAATLKLDIPVQSDKDGALRAVPVRAFVAVTLSEPGKTAPLPWPWWTAPAAWPSPPRAPRAAWT